MDVGCGYGRFALQYAKMHPEHNVLGLEIRLPAVQRALLCAPLLTAHISVSHMSAGAW